MVSVICIAYNHEKFIKDAIEGVVGQKADFSYELIIHDDASTDGTAKIIKEYEEKYPQIIRGIYQAENQFFKCNIVAEFLFPVVRGKYIAFCEGDDYWTDEKKLQKQVDFLETHRDYSMCMHNAVRLNYETGERSKLDTFPESGTYSQKEQILAGCGSDFPAFASYLLRTEFLKDIPDFFLRARVMDYPLRQYYASRGKVYYFEEAMSVYRVAIPQSYMKKTSQDQLFYNNYTLNMICFFEEFDRYTVKKFSDIIGDKLISDYFGFCTSIPEEEGMEKALRNGLDLGKIKKCYQCLSLEYLDKNIQQIYEKADSLFIYGTSRLAFVCKAQLEQAGLQMKGFVVSDGQMKADELSGKKIFYLSEVMETYHNPGFVLAVQPINIPVIEEKMGKYGVKNYCKPYMA